MEKERRKSNKAAAKIAVLSVIVLACVALSLDTPISNSLRKGIKEAIDYDMGLSAGFRKAEELVSGRPVASDNVLFFMPPVKGNVTACFKDSGRYTEYTCDLIHSVYSVCGGTVTQAAHAEGDCMVEVDSGQGIVCRIEGLDALYLKEGERVTAGQLAGSAADGKVRVTIIKDGVCVDSALYID